MRFNFDSNEKRILENIDRARSKERQHRGTELAETAKRITGRQYENAHKHILEQSIDPGTFSDLYGEEVIAEDQERVAKRKELFAETDNEIEYDDLTKEDIRKVSEIAEFIALAGFNQGRWLPFCRALKTSEFDDIFRGVDMVLEYQRENDPASHLGLAVDVTCAKTMNKKLLRNKEMIDNGTMTNVKYFDSEKSHIRGELKNLPRIVVAIDIPTIERLLKVMGEGDGLKDHIAKLYVLRQMEMQLDAYTEYAQKVDSPTAKYYERAKIFIGIFIRHYEEQLKEKEDLISNERMMVALKRGLESHFG